MRGQNTLIGEGTGAVSDRVWANVPSYPPVDVVSGDAPVHWSGGALVERKGNKKDKNMWRGITLLSVGSKLLARVVATWLRSWFDGHLGLHQFGFRRGKGLMMLFKLPVDW